MSRKVAGLKPVWWVVVVVSFIVVPQLVMFVITRIVVNPSLSWAWMVWTGVFQLVVIVVGVIVVAIVVNKGVDEVKIQIDPKDAEEKAKKRILMDPNNADNFVVEERVIMRVGESGAERTRILHLSGFGYEFGQKIDVLVNLDNTKIFDMTDLRDRTPEFVEARGKRMAENPETEVVEGSGTVGYTALGQPITQTFRRYVSRVEKEKKEQQEKADLAGAF